MLYVCNNAPAGERGALEAPTAHKPTQTQTHTHAHTRAEWLSHALIHLRSSENGTSLEFVPQFRRAAKRALNALGWTAA